MAFTVEDFHDLIELLAQHPEWRAELRRHVLSDDLIELPALVRQLVEAQTRAEARLGGVEARLDRVEARMDRVEAAILALTEAQTRVEARLERVENQLGELAVAQARTESVLRELTGAVERIDDRVGTLEGDLLELHFARRGPAYLSRIARRLRVIEPRPLADTLDDAVEDGRLTQEDRETVMLADVVLAGRRRSDGEEVYLLAEVSAGIRPYDVERAAERATLLAKLGRPVLPIVAGRSINEEAGELARDRGVWTALGGLVTAPRGA